MRIGELFMALGFDVNDQKLDSFDKKIEHLQSSMAFTAAKTTAALWAFDKFIDGSIRGAVALANLNNQFGLSSEKAQKWQIVAQLKNIGASAEEVMGSIQTLQNNLTQIHMNQGNAAPFLMMGIDVRGKDAFDVLEQLRTRIAGLPRGTATNLLTQMGLSPNLLDTLQMTREEFDKLGNSYIISHDATQNLIYSGTAMREFALWFTKWKAEVLGNISPILEKVIYRVEELGQKFVEFTKDLADHPEKLEEFAEKLKLVAAALVALYIAMNPVKAAVYALIAAIMFPDVADNIFQKLIEDAQAYQRALEDVIRDTLFLSNLNPQLSYTKISPEMMSAAMVRAQSQPSAGGQTTIQNTFYVDGSSDPYSTAQEIGGYLQDTLDKTLDIFNNGGR